MAGTFETSRRREVLSFSHHREIAVHRQPVSIGSVEQGVGDLEHPREPGKRRRMKSYLETRSARTRWGVMEKKVVVYRFKRLVDGRELSPEHLWGTPDAIAWLAGCTQLEGSAREVPADVLEGDFYFESFKTIDLKIEDVVTASSDEKRHDQDSDEGEYQKGS